jgi:hypothetical protein
MLFLDDAWDDVKNMQIYPTGTIQKRNGCAIKQDTPVRPGTNIPITYIHQYWTAAETAYLLMFAPKVAGTSAGCWEYVSRSSQTARGGSALSAWSGDLDDRILGTTFADCFVITSMNGANQPAYWDAPGGHSNFISMPPSCYPGRAIEAFKNYLFIGGVTSGGEYRPGRIRWSQPGLFRTNSDWPAANYIDLDPDDGDRITAMKALGDALIVFKEKRIYIVKYIGGPWVFDYSLAKTGVGCVSGHSVVTVEEKLIFLSEDGFYSFDGTNVAELSKKIKDKVIEINPDYRMHVTGSVYKASDQIWFTMPYDGGDTIAGQSPMASHPINETWVYDYKRKYWTRFDLAPAALGSWYNETDLTIGDLVEPFNHYTWAWNDRLGRSALSQLVGSDYQGHIHDLDTGSFDAAETKAISSTAEASGIDAWIKTRWLDFGNPIATKRIYRTVFMPSLEGDEASHHLDVTFNLNWGADASAGSGSFPLSGDTTIPTKEQRIDWTKQFRSLQIKQGCDLGGEPCETHEIIIEFETKGRTGDPSWG